MLNIIDQIAYWIGARYEDSVEIKNMRKYMVSEYAYNK